MKQLGEFRRRYFEAKRQCMAMATPLIIETLPKMHMCFIELASDEHIPGFGLSESECNTQDFFRQYKSSGVHPEDRMVNWIGRDFSPQAIEISVYSANAITTTFELHVVGAFTGSKVHFLPRNDQTVEPWIPKPPRNPAEWQSVAESGRFSINWHWHKIGRTGSSS